MKDTIFSWDSEDAKFRINCITEDNGITIHYELVEIIQIGLDSYLPEVKYTGDKMFYDFAGWVGLFHGPRLFLVTLSGNSFDGFKMLVIEGTRN